MECWAFSKPKSWLYWSLMLMMIHIFVVWHTQGNCIEEERKALLEIKASHTRTYDSEIEHFLPTWVDYGSGAPGDGGRDCCDWERVSCNTSTGHVVELSLYYLRGINDNIKFWSKLWPLNVSLFLHFKELRLLNLSNDLLDKEIVKTGLEKLSSLRKLEVLDLSGNDDIDNDILPSLKTLTSLKILDLSYTGLNGNFPTNEFAALKNLELLDLSNCNFNGFESVSNLRKLKSLNHGYDRFNESAATSLNTLSLLTNLDLSYNPLLGPFPAQEIAHLTNLEKLDLSFSQLNGTPDIQACKSLSRLKRLDSINLSGNNFNKSVMHCLSALPSLKILDLSHSLSLESSFPIQEFNDLPDLKVVLLSENGFSGTLLPVLEAFTSFHQLEVLDLSWNHFVGSVPSAIHALSSLRAVSFAYNYLNGSLPDHTGLCELKNLQELDLSHNMLDGILPRCLKNLSVLKLLDISSNRFTGKLLPSLIANLTSLKYIDFSHNNFEGSFSFSSFSNHIKLELVRFISDNDRFEVETEEPIDWFPMFQLKVLVLSNCNVNRNKGRVVPGFLLHQHMLQEVDMSHNHLEEQFPNWLIKNNTNLEVLNLRNNSFSNMLLHRNANMLELDVSGNYMVGTIPNDIQKFFPYIHHLNLSKNALNGAIPSSLGDLSELVVLDLSENELSGEVPKKLFTDISKLEVLKLSKNRLHGNILAGNLSFGYIQELHLYSNCFTGKITIEPSKYDNLMIMDISNNFFTGMIPRWISNMSKLSELSVRNNSLQGRFPCGATSYSFLDISQNSFSGPIPFCLNLQYVEHLHLGSNRLSGSIPDYFCNLTNVLTLDLSNNNLSGMIPKFLGQLSTLRILLLRKNNFSGSIPKQLCQLRDVSLLDLSNNSFSGSIPSCLKNITGPSYLAFLKTTIAWYPTSSSYDYKSVLWRWQPSHVNNEGFKMQDQVQFTTKSLFLPYKGDILDYMSGMDLSCNKLTGEIPEELGLLTQIRALNLSHNWLTGPIPVNFSNLAKIESLDLSSNDLTGKVPSELIKLISLSTFNVSHNNLSGRLPEMKAQFGTFTEASYEMNPLLCGPPLEKKCMGTDSQAMTNPSAKEDNEKWYDIDMTCFYASSGTTCLVLLLGFVALLYINRQWRRRWLHWIEGSMFTCYYFLCDLATRPFVLFRK